MFWWWEENIKANIKLFIENFRLDFLIFFFLLLFVCLCYFVLFCWCMLYIMYVFLCYYQRYSFIEHVTRWPKNTFSKHSRNIEHHHDHTHNTIKPSDMNNIMCLPQDTIANNETGNKLYSNVENMFLLL